MWLPLTVCFDHRTSHILLLTGFKSYLKHATLGPFQPFSCIIGPNGCGKSVVVRIS